jgi:GDPmannose 4,6-dehydratase
MTKCALIVGSGGQDGRLLYDFLLQRGYDVIGIEKTSVRSNRSIVYHSVDILNGDEVTALLSSLQPNEVYYLAAFHHSSEDKVLHLAPRQMLQASMDIHVRGLINFLEAILQSSRQSRLFYAASCRVFGNPSRAPQDEQTPFNPVCAYGISKAAGVQCCRYYRQEHDVFAATGILYNHESHLRKESFVSQKIIRGARRIQQKRQDRLILGNLSITRDWGYAPDYVEAMQRLLQLGKPEDVVIATGEGHSVKQFVQIAFNLLGLDWEHYVMEEPHILQGPQPVYIGDPQRLIKLTGWRPSLSFQEMISQLMIHNAQEMDA